MNVKKIPAELWIIVGAAILLIPFLGSTHLFDWDEINFAEASREMMATHNYSIPQIDFEPFWEKPPLFFWLQVLCMKALGINEFASRLPNALCGIATLVLVYRIGKQKVNKQFGAIWVFVYIGSLLPQFYFKSGIIDPWFNLFIFLSIYQLSQYSHELVQDKIRHILLGGLWCGLAVMTKGPVALLVIGLCYGVYSLLNRFRGFMKPGHILLFLLISTLVGGIWFVALLAYGQQRVILDFFAYQVKLFTTEDAGHGGPFYYHFFILLIGCFPAAALCILSMQRKANHQINTSLHRWMLILFWVVLILFSIVKTKIVHYSSLCYFPLTYLAAESFYHVYYKRWVLPAWTKWLQGFCGVLLGLSLIAAASIERWKYIFLAPGRLNDEFARASLSAHVHWSGLEILPGILFLIGITAFLFDASKNPKQALIFLFGISLIAINLTISMITPKVEPYSQGAMIEFFQSKQKEHAIIETLRFKSYAHLFYGLRPADLGKPRADSIRFQNLDKNVPVYIVGKIQNAKENENEYPALKRLYEKNGFIFYQLKR
ncbi:MAG: phospholipid carrier-dependent glycosyltransferase [Flavisolibacter sp.]